MFQAFIVSRATWIGVKIRVILYTASSLENESDLLYVTLTVRRPSVPFGFLAERCSLRSTRIIVVQCQAAKPTPKSDSQLLFDCLTYEFPSSLYYFIIPAMNQETYLNSCISM